MKIETLHDWRVSIPEAMAIQRRLAGLVSRTDAVTAPRFVAGLDISVNKPVGTAAVVVLSYPEMELIEVQTAAGRLEFPYVPGLLSFREAPLTIAACEKLTVTPDLFLVDGHGYAHPRRMGIACHLGLLLNTPTIGCAKSLLCGDYETPGTEAGSFSDITDGGEVIGAAVRTKTGVKPVFVSIGHKVSLPSAITWVRNCCRKYRLPEPSRLAHLAANGRLNTAKIRVGAPL